MFLAEGPHVAAAALAANAPLEALFVAEDRTADAEISALTTKAYAAGVETIVVGARDLARIADTDTPQRKSSSPDWPACPA